MNESAITVGAMLRFGWETFKARPWVFIGVLAIVLVVSTISSTIVQVAGDESGLLGFLAVLFDIAVQTFIGLGLIAFTIRAHDAVQEVRIEDLWHPTHFWKYLVASIVLGFTILIGYLLFIIPGVIFTIWFLFTPYIVVSKGVWPIEAMKESMRLTEGNRMTLFLLLLAVIGINILGAIALLVGLLVTIPVTTLAIAHAWRLLEQRAPSAAPAASAAPQTSS